MAALELLMFAGEFVLGDTDDEFVLEGTNTEVDPCCCPNVDCTDLNCDCTVIDTQGTQYRVRKKTGDFTGCDTDCLDIVDDDFDTAGGGTAGAGIDLDETGLPGASCEFESDPQSYCDCDLVPPDITPANVVLTIECIEVGGVCKVKGTLALGQFRWENNDFDVTAGSGNKQVFTKTVASSCCPNIPNEMEVWKSAG